MSNQSSEQNQGELKVWPAGYTDTPVLPGTSWRVHDPDRPQPPVVSVSGMQPQAAPPGDAIVLFDGADLSSWTHLDGRAAEWRIEDNELCVVPGTRDVRSVAEFGSVQLHVEWRAPKTITATSQGRGNSGVFLMGLYEVQVLDGFANPTYADGATAAIYGQHPPLVNACVPPGDWHSYDIVFEAPVFDADGLVTPAFLTVFHNGVLVHIRQTIAGPTQHKVLANYDTTRATRGPLVLQDHRDKVRFRNIWLRELTKLEAD